MGSIEGDVDTWPGGYPFVIRGTVGEDATAGTHVCSLTVTPGAGNELEVLYGGVVAKAHADVATAQGRVVAGGAEIVSSFAAAGPVGGAISAASVLVNNLQKAWEDERARATEKLRKMGLA